MGGKREVLNVEEAADLLGVTPWTVREQARSGQLPANKVGREWRFSRTALDEYLYGHRPETTGSGPSDEDTAWLEADEHELPAYDWGPAGPPAGRPLVYVPGVGLTVAVDDAGDA